MNEIDTKKNPISTLTGGQKLQAELLAELEKTASVTGQDFTEYGKKCVMNAIAGLVVYCKNNTIELSSIDPTLLRLSLQNIGYTELNYAAIPSEVYFDFRKDGDKYLVTAKPQGAGNEKLTRLYGVGLKKDIGLKTPWLVREGDEFVLPQYDGLKMTPPKWIPKSLDGKVITIVYPAEKIDGTVEYLIATRESVKSNIIAQVRQNALYKFTTEKTYGNKTYKTPDKEKRDEFYSKVDELAEELSVDEFIRHPEIKPFINPTYTSGGSRESMIIRKMKNNALKNYPKEYDNAYIKEAVVGMFEEADESLSEKPEAIEVDMVEKVEKEIEEAPVEDAVQDFRVSEQGEVKEEAKVEAKAEPEKESSEEADYNDLF